MESEAWRTSSSSRVGLGTFQFHGIDTPLVRNRLYRDRFKMGVSTSTRGVPGSYKELERPMETLRENLEAEDEPTECPLSLKQLKR